MNNILNLLEKIIENWIKKYRPFTIALVVVLSVWILSLIKWWIIGCEALVCQSLFIVPGPYKTILYIVSLAILTTALLKLWGDILYPKAFTPIRVWSRRLIKLDKDISLIPDLSRWIYQGSLYKEEFLEITSSNSGALIKNPIFRNFVMNFHLHIKNGGGIGVLFRAQNLENYLMLQIGIWDNGSNPWSDRIVITPHIRFAGSFESLNVDKREPYFYFNDLVYSALPGNKDLKVKLDVVDNVATLTVNDQEFIWNIPTNVEPNIIQKPGKEDQENSKPAFDLLGPDLKSKLWFRNRYGMIGFRAYGLEKARISNLSVEKTS